MTQAANPSHRPSTPPPASPLLEHGADTTRTSIPTVTTVGFSILQRLLWSGTPSHHSFFSAPQLCRHLALPSSSSMVQIYGWVWTLLPPSAHTLSSLYPPLSPPCDRGPHRCPSPILLHRSARGFHLRLPCSTVISSLCPVFAFEVLISLTSSKIFVIECFLSLCIIDSLHTSYPRSLRKHLCPKVRVAMQRRPC